MNNKLFIQNLPKPIAEFELRLYLENVFGDIDINIQKVDFSPDRSQAVVYLQDALQESDIANVDRDNSKIFKKRVLTIGTAPFCLKVTGIPKGTSEESLSLYFESKRCGVTGKDMLAFINAYGTSAIVAYKLQKDCDKVVKNGNHKIGDTPVKVESCPFAWNVTPDKDDHEDEEEEEDVEEGKEEEKKGPKTTERKTSTPHPEEKRDSVTRERTHTSRPRGAARPLSSIRDRMGMKREATVVTKVEPQPLVKDRTDPIPNAKYKVVKEQLWHEINALGVKVKAEKKSDSEIELILKGTESDVNRAKVRFYEIVLKVKEMEVRVKPEISKLCMRDGGKRIQQLLKSVGIKTDVRVQSGCLLVYTSADDRDKIQQVITGTFTEATVKTDKAQHYLKSEDWASFKHTLDRNGEVIVNEQPGYVQLHGYKTAVNDTKNTLEKLFSGKRYQIESIAVQYDTVFRYLEENMKKKWDEIQKQHRDVSIECEDSAPEFSVKVKGPKKAVSDALPKVRKVVQSVKHKVFDTEKEGMSKYFSESEGQGQIRNIESQNKCVIGIQQNASTMGQRVSTPSKSNITVEQGSITSAKADVLVNCVGCDDADLTNCGLLAKLFASDGGKALQDAFTKNGGLKDWTVASTPPGALPCKRVYHMSIRQWNGNTTKKALQQMIEGCLVQASKHGCRTIAFPPIGCGNWNYPLHDVAQCFTESANIAPNMQLKIVVFRDTQLQNDLQVALGIGAPTCSTKPSNVELASGDITSAQADVLVCSIGSDSVDLNGVGAVGEAFAAAAGQTLTDEFKNLGGLQDGSTAVCKNVGSLKCKAVLFAGIRQWKGSQKNLTGLISNCLQQVAKNGYTSVIFPTLGCGQFRTPPTDLADCLMQCAANFPTIKITVMSYKKDGIHNSIEAALLSGSSPSAGSSPSVNFPNVKIIKGDIVKTQASILVNSVAGDSADLGKCGPIATAFKRAGGQQLADDFSKGGVLSEGGISMYDGDTGQLKCDVVIHLGIRKWNDAQSAQILSEMIQKSVGTAHENRLSSIAFPTLGCGQLQYPLQDVVRCFKQAATNFSSVQIIIVAFDKSHYDQFTQAFSTGRAVTAAFESQMLRFHICSDNEKSLTAANAGIEACINKCYTTTSFGDENIAYLPHVDRKFKAEIDNLPCHFLVRVIDVQQSSVTLSGVKQEVLEQEKQIHEILAKVTPHVTGQMVKQVKGVEEYMLFLTGQEIKTPGTWKKYKSLTRDKAMTAASTISDANDYLVSADAKVTQGLTNLLRGAWSGTQANPNATVKVLTAWHIENPVAYCDYMHKLKPYFEGRVRAPYRAVSSFANEPEVTTATIRIDLLQRERIPEINEYFFFHGTSLSAVKQIISQNLDFRLGREGGLFGKGVYLAESASKSHQYTDNAAERYMFVVRAPLGKIFYCQKSRKFSRAPCTVCQKEVGCEHNSFYDSILGKHEDTTETRFKFREFMLYEKGLTYLAYLIKYAVEE